ncbi:pectate lyase family protein [[Clostridium] polysaccharolyticum]|uniref:Pectin lyase n=1 Tax=[Clostridium] polysaccharolyticum TaxID=29364 RepID=A0A1I0CT11_9FIRM|nr:cellulose binding domain-containing protein [[Clostridium] polysaccharolyticum]SET22805.1 pectin lyase [[Clostridium] polysaccharolyticum]
MKKQIGKRIAGLFLAGTLMVSCWTGGMPKFTTEKQTVVAASFAEYPAELVRISTANGSRNLNISGTADGATLNTDTTRGTQNENWRFDYVVSGVFRIVNMGTGKVLATRNDSTNGGTSCVIAPCTLSKAQYWNVTQVSADNLGNGLYYKITNYLDQSKALTYNSGSNTITLETYSGNSNQKFRLNTAGLQGFAAEGKQINGAEKASAIGGLLGETVFVDTYDKLAQEASGSTPKTIVITKDLSYTGGFNYDNEGRRYPKSKINLGNNKTIIGSYGAHKIHNGYIVTNGGNGRNNILRNITVSHDESSNHINVWEFSNGNNLWLDHITFMGHSNINTSSYGGDIDKLLSIVGTYDYATVSDCTFGKHEYGVILGYPTDTDEALSAYKGKPCVTIMTNYFNSCITRAPGLMRYGYFHSANNYVYDFHLAYTMHTGANIYTEKNYYDGAGNIGSVVNDDALNITSISNATVGKVGPWYTDNGSIAVRCYNNNNLRNVSSLSTSWRPSNQYSYKVIGASDVPNYCRSNAGAKMSCNDMAYAAFSQKGVPIASYLVTGQSTPSYPSPTPSQWVQPSKNPVPSVTPSNAPTAVAPPNENPSTGNVIDISADGNSWSGGYTMNLTLKNVSGNNISDWTLYLNKSEADITSLWCGKMQSLGNQVMIRPESYNQNLGAGGSLTFGFGGNGTMPNALSYKFVYIVNGKEYTSTGVDSSL